MNNAKRKERYHSDSKFRTELLAKQRRYYHEKIKISKESLLLHRAKTKENQRTRRERLQETRKELQQFLGGKCIDCGLTDWRLLDFDHKDPKHKLFNISQKLHLPIAELLIEVKKCELRCPNCHRIKTVESKEHDSYKLRSYRNKYNQQFKSLLSSNQRQDNRLYTEDS